MAIRAKRKQEEVATGRDTEARLIARGKELLNAVALAELAFLQGYSKEEDFFGAFDLCNRAIELEPNLAEAHLIRGVTIQRLWSRLNKREVAIREMLVTEISKAYRRAAELDSSIGRRFGLANADIIAFDESKKPGYTDEYMGDTAQDLNAEARKLGFTFESALETLRQASATARETTGRATAEPRPETAHTPDTASAPARPAPRQVTAEGLFGDVPPGLQAKPRQKYNFPPELLDDPGAVSRAQSLANARNYKIKKGDKVTPEEDARGKMAESFVRQAQRRQKRAEGSPQLRAG